MGVQGIYKRDSTGRRYLAYTIKEDSEGRRTTKSYTSKGQEIIQSQQKAEAEAQKRIEEIQRAEAQKKELIQAQEKVKAQQQEQIKQERIIQAQTQAIQQQSETQPTFRPNQQQSRVTINEPAPQQTQTTQYPTRYDIEGNPYTPAPKITTETKDVGSRTYQTEAGLVTETTKETTTTLSFKEPNFKDVIGYNKYKKKLEEADLERYKKEGIDLKQIKITGGEAVIPKPTKEQNAVLLEASRGVNKQNVDKVFQSDILKQAKYERMQQTGTSLEQSDFLRQAVPEVFQRQTQQIQAERNVQEFFQKERAKTTAILVGTTIATAGAGTLITAGISSLAVSSPVLAGTIATGTKVIGTGLKYVYGASVVKRGTAIATGYDFSFKEMKIIQPYENKPIARSIDAIQLIAEVGGVYLGAKILKASAKTKELDIDTYETKRGTQVTASKEGRAIRVVETGTIKTKSGEIKDVYTSILADAGTGKGTIKTQVLTTKGGKTKVVFESNRPISIEKNILYSEAGLKSNSLKVEGLRISEGIKTQIKPNVIDTTINKNIQGENVGITTKAKNLPYKQQYEFKLLDEKGNVLTTLTGGANIQPTIKENLYFSKTGANIRTEKIKDFRKEITEIKSTGKVLESLKTTDTGTFKITTKEPILTGESSKVTNIKTQALPIKRLYGEPITALITETRTNQFISTNKIVDTSLIPSSQLTKASIGSFKQENILIPLVIPSTKLKGEQEERTSLKTISRPQTITLIDSKIEETTKQIPKPVEETITKTDTKTKTKPVTIQEPIPVEQTEIITTPVTPPPPTIITTTTIVPPPQFDFPKLEKTKQKAGKGFDVLVRSKGKFVKVNVGGSLTETQALDFGAFKVATSPLASFKIQESTAPLTTINGKSRGMFTRTRRNLYTKDNVFIEKKEKRIKSFGEKVGITYKGLKTIKEKKTKGIFEKWKVF
jgi:hypothetical protein